MNHQNGKRYSSVSFHLARLSIVLILLSTFAIVLQWRPTATPVVRPIPTGGLLARSGGLMAEQELAERGAGKFAIADDREEAESALVSPIPTAAHPDPLLSKNNLPTSSTDGLIRLNTWDGIRADQMGCTSTQACAPDTNGAAGPNYYVQVVNHMYAVWTKNGTQVLAPRRIAQLWSDPNDVCAGNFFPDPGLTDPIVLYDHLANRWVLSQVTDHVPYDACIAVSSSADPTGSWYTYSFQLGTNAFFDYPKLAVWPDGYYMSAQECISENCLPGAGARAFVFQRSKMLVNDRTATFQWQAPPNVYHMLPADLDGLTSPPSGAPAYYVGYQGTSTWYSNTALEVFKYQVDWGNQANSRFDLVATLTVNAWTAGCVRNCVPQPPVNVINQNLDGLGLYLMNRLAYRNQGDHESLLVNQTVDVGGGRTGIRWYEIRNPTTGPYLAQQGTFAPNDENYRWIGSMAMDRDGNIGLGYSVSGAQTYPSIRFSGHAATDPPGSMAGEQSFYLGLGVQNWILGFTNSRWGDYSGLVVDPADDCTFWYTNEYYPANSATNWYTRIGQFKFDTCGTSPTATPTRTAVPNTSTPIPTPTQPGASFTLTSPTYNVQVNQQVQVSVRLHSNNYTFLQSRGDLLDSLDATRYGAWQFQPVLGTVSPGQDFDFNRPDLFTMTAPGTPGTYQVRWQMRVNGTLIGPISTVTLNVSPGAPTATPVPAGTWHAQYYSNEYLSGSPCWEGDEVTGDLLFRDWSQGGHPPSSCPSQGFSARFELRATYFTDATYSFHCEHNGGCRLYVDDLSNPKIDAWGASGGHDWAGHLAGGNHVVRVEYHQNGDSAPRIGAWWRGPGFLPNNDPGDPAQWQVDYYGFRSTAGTSALTLNGGSSPAVDQDWGTNGPGYGLPFENFAVRYLRTMTWACGTYQFTVFADDGFRLWVNNQVIVDRWDTFGNWSGAVTVPGGSTQVALEYNQRTGAASVHMAWSQTAACTATPVPPSNGAGFITQVIPLSSLVAGQTLPVALTLQNTGTTTWTSAANYRLGSQNPPDNQTWGLARVALPGSVAPGDYATFNFTIQAPLTPGTYNFQWRMVQDGVGWFGDLSPNVVITVLAPTNTPIPPTTPPGTPSSTVVVPLTSTPTSTPCASLTAVSGAITATDPTAGSRLFRSGVLSSCGAPKGYPGPIAGGPFHYDVYSFTNAGGPACLEVRLDATGCGGTQIFAAAYLGTVDPADLSVGYAGDAGFSDAQQTFTVNVAAGATYSVLVEEVLANSGCASYRLTIGSCALQAPATRTPGPTTTPSAASPTPISFSDVQPSDYFYGPVQYLAARGVISGYADGTFRPYNNTTRGQLAKIMVVAQGWPFDTTGGPHFTDVPATNPFYSFIETAYHHNLISGYADGTFRWGSNVTRGQLSKIIVAAEGWPADITGGPHFTDVPPANPFYVPIETAYHYGIVSGYSDSTFRVGSNATRGQIAKIVYMALTGPGPLPSATPAACTAGTWATRTPVSPGDSKRRRRGLQWRSVQLWGGYGRRSRPGERVSLQSGGQYLGASGLPPRLARGRERGK